MSQLLILRQPRSNGRRQACGATNWWIAFGPHEPTEYGRTGGGSVSSGVERLPQPLDALGGVEQRVVAAHRVVDQPLVGLEHVGLAPGLVERELQAQLVEPHAGPGPLAVERQRQLRRVGEVERQVVGAVRADARAGREHALRRLAEGDRDDARPLGHLLAGAQVERHARPAPVVDVAAQGDERLGLRVGCNARLVAIADVLPADDLARLDRQHGAEDLVLLLADRARLERGRRLHRHEGEHLEQVGDDHVAVGAGRLVEAGSRLEAEGLGHVDLHVVDVVAVPDRLEQPVGEPEGEDVLRRLLAEEVVDAEDLRLVEGLVEDGVELAGAVQVGAERLLHDDPGALDQVGLGEDLDHGASAAFGGTLR